MARKIEVALIGDARSLNRAFSSSQSAGGKWAGRMKSVAKTGGLALAAGVGLAVVGLKKSVDAAKEAEVSQNRMKAQLKAAGISYEKYAKQIDKTLESQSKLSAFDDEELADSFTNLVRITGDVNEALKLNALAADFARAKGIPAAKAGELIGKVAGGNIGILSRYGIQLKEGATAQEALAVLQKKFAGQAEAYGKSTAGAQERFGVAVENLQEKIGAKLLPILVKLAEWGVQFVEWAERNWPRFQEVAGRAFDVIREKAETAMAWFRENVLPTIEAIVSGAQAFWARFGEDIKRNLAAAVGVVRNMLNVLKGIFELVMALIRGDWAAAWEALKGIARNALSALIAVVRTIVTNFFNAAKALGSAIVRGLVSGVAALASKVAELIGKAVSKVRDFRSQFISAAISLGQAIISGIVSGLTGLFDAVKDKIVDGVTGAIDWAKGHLGSTAEQYAARQLGEPIGMGIAKGIAAQMGGVQSALKLTATGGGARVGGGGAASIPAPRAAAASSGSSGGPGQFALIWAGPDFLRWMEDQQRRQRRSGRLA